MGQVLEDKLELVRGDAALVIFTEHPEAFLKNKLNSSLMRFILFVFGSKLSYLVFIFKVRLRIFLNQNLAKFCEIYQSSSIFNLVDYFIDLNL